MCIFGANVLSSHCPACDKPMNPGFAWCRSCGSARPEFSKFTKLIRKTEEACVFSGAETDVLLPNGDAVWAPYVLDLIHEGCLDEKLQYTPKFFKYFPNRGQATNKL